MADFNTHFFGAVTVASLTSTCATKLLTLSTGDGLMIMAAGIVGGILPDIDLKRSQPSRVLFSGLGLLAAVAWIFTSLHDYTGVELWIGAVAAYLLVRYPVYAAFHKVAVHRGSLHSLLAAVMVGIVTCAVAWHAMEIKPLQAWLTGLAMTLGYLVHLTLDEIYSVDFAGVRIKRSFGSALKPIDLQRLPASCLLLFITLTAWFYTPHYSLAVQDLQQRHIQWQPALIPNWLPVDIENTDNTTH